MYRIRVILDAEDDVIRDIDISENSNFTALHDQIVEAFNFEKGELAAFFASNDDWEQGEEISLMDFGAMSGSKARLMSDVILKEFLSELGSKMIYVYDLLNLWTFYVDLIKTDIPESSDSRIIKIVGERPAEAPSKSMESTNLEEDYGLEDFENDDFEEDDPYDFNLN
tara:strand:- start:30288 stop:30791 length:504 start_codon:yes stop_codon:yes gene_type:complete